MIKDAKMKLSILPIEKISQSSSFDTHKNVQELTNSIINHGLIEPIIVRKRGAGYSVIKGENRLFAAKKAGLLEVNCLIISCNTLEGIILSLVLNSRNSDNFLENAVMINSLLNEWGISALEISQTLGINTEKLREKLSVLNFSDSEIKIIKDAHISEEQALVSLSIKDKDREKFLYYIAHKGLNLSKTKELVQKIKFKKKGQTLKSLVPLDIRLYSNTIENTVKTMKNAGIDVKSEKYEREEFIEYVIKIPKNNLNDNVLSVSGKNAMSKFKETG